MSVNPQDAIPVPVITEVEPGYKTTEFYLALATNIISLLFVFHIVTVTSDQTQAILGFIGLIVPNAIYILSRGIRKIGQ